MPPQLLKLNPLHSQSFFWSRGDTDLPVHQRQWFERAEENGNPQFWCYSERLCYLEGEIVRLYGICTESRVELSFALDRAPGQKSFEHRFTVNTRWQDTPEDASVAGCGWPQILEFRIPDHWPPGPYLIRARSGESEQIEYSYTHLITLRHQPVNPHTVLLVTGDSTWNAYNDWGGSNHYEGIVDPLSNRFSPQLSNQRPWARGFISLPSDAPRTIPDQQPGHGDPVSYPHMEWAFAHGYSKKYASAGWASYERHFLNWAVSAGFDIHLASQQELHYQPERLFQYPCMVFAGHDEYWSWQMRDALDAYVEQGGHVARFAGNYLWQIRLEDEGQCQICYKYKARKDDPYLGGSNAHLVTTCWDDPLIDRPGHLSVGLDALQGVYAGFGGLAPRGSPGFTVYRPEHWSMADTSLGYGDILGSQGRVFGYEVDGLAHQIVEGLPVPVDSTVPDDLEIIAMGLARMKEDPFNTETSLFVGNEDARYAASIRYGNVSPETLKRVDRGSGMVVHFSRGKGQVFNAGTTEWVAGLLRYDPGVTQVTENVIRRFVGG